MAKCIICGAEFPDAMVQIPVDSRMKTAPKEICDECVSTPGRRSGIVREPGEKIEPYADLAGDTCMVLWTSIRAHTRRHSKAL